MDIDVDEAVQRAAGDLAAGERLIAELLDIRANTRMYNQAQERFYATDSAGPAACVAAAVQATPRQLGRLYKPLLEVGGPEAAWAVLLAAGAGAGHIRAVDAAVDQLTCDIRLMPSGARPEAGNDKWVCAPQTATAIERGLGFTPGDITTPRRHPRRRVVACLRPLTAAELKWWDGAGHHLALHGHLLADPHTNTSCDSLNWLLHCTSRKNVPSAAAKVAERMTIDSAGRVPPADVVAVLTALHTYRPDLCDDLFAAHGANWHVSRHSPQPRYGLLGHTTRPRAVWNAPLILAAQQHLYLAFRLWLATHTAPQADAVAAAAAQLNPESAAVAGALSTLLPDHRYDDRIAALIDADPQAVADHHLAVHLPEAYMGTPGMSRHCAGALLKAASAGTADDWLLGNLDGYPPPPAGTAADVLADTGTTVLPLTAVEAFRDGTITAADVPRIVEKWQWDRFRRHYGSRPAILPEALHDVQVAH